MSFLPSAAIGANGYCRHFMHPECPKWHYCSNSLRISAIGLKFVWIIHSTMKQIANWLLCTAIFASFMELWSFHDRLGTGVGDDGATLNSSKIWAISLKFGGMMHSTITQIAIYNGYARLFLCIHWTSTFSMTGLDQVWRKLTHISKCEEITLQPGIWWHDEMHHEVDHYLKWPCIFWSRPAKGAVILWMSHCDMQDDYLSQHCCLYNDFLNFGVIYFIAFRNIVSWHHENEPAN